GHVKTGNKAAVHQRHMAAHINMNGGAQVLGFGLDAAGFLHDGGGGFAATGAHHGDGFGGGVYGDFVLLGNLVANQVGVNKIRVGEIQQVFHGQLGTAVEVQVAAHIGGQAA